MSSYNNINSHYYGPWFIITIQLSTHLPTHSKCQLWNGFIKTVSPFKVYDQRQTKHNYGYQWLFVLEQYLNDWLRLSAAHHNINTTGSWGPLLDMQLFKHSINHQHYISKRYKINPNRLVDKLIVECFLLARHIKIYDNDLAKTKSRRHHTNNLD